MVTPSRSLGMPGSRQMPETLFLRLLADDKAIRRRPYAWPSLLTTGVVRAGPQGPQSR